VRIGTAVIVLPAAQYRSGRRRGRHVGCAEWRTHGSRRWQWTYRKN
jgi:hypothetical protein